MRNVHLHGALGRKYGENFRFAVDTPIQAVRLLIANFPGFKHDLAQGEYRLMRGDPETGFPLKADCLAMSLGKHDFHLIPVATGGKKQGIGKAILGAVIVVAAIALAPATGGASAGGAATAAAGQGAAGGLAAEAFLGLTYGNIAIFGAALALGGVTQLISPQPSTGDYSERERPEERPSFLFSGPINTTEQGGILPIVIGRVIVGSKVISASLAVEQL